MVPVLFGLSIVLFTFIHILPGDPAVAILGEHARPDLIRQLRQNLGLDKPLYLQYFTYLGQLGHGDLGSSIIDGRPVAREFFSRLPATIELSVFALAFASGVGIWLGRVAARHPQSWIDGIVTGGSVLGVSIPLFVTGLTLEFIFGVVLGILPVSGRIDPRLGIEPVTNFMLVDTILAGRPDAFVDALKHLILPALTLGSIPVAIISRITRASVIEVLNEDYVRTARAKGLTDQRINTRHVMRNAWLPVSTVLGLQVGYMLSGATITETVFAWPGVGRWVVDAITGRDYFVVQSSILLFALMFLVVNLAVDVMYAVLNPRIRYS
jgi:ABC-type dipeptide/oligopeptide/nickel transport system permease component